MERNISMEEEGLNTVHQGALYWASLSK